MSISTVDASIVAKVTAEMSVYEHYEVEVDGSDILVYDEDAQAPVLARVVIDDMRRVADEHNMRFMVVSRDGRPTVRLYRGG